MNGILKCSGTGEVKNIGDYIQSVAQEQFWEHKDCFVERESLNTFSANETVNVIMNAWFMWMPQNFPPSSIINPLFVSFHIVPQIASQMLTDKSIEYLKKYEPIGARDTGTMELLRNYGIESYFSGCLTLTLGEKYKSDKKNEAVYFVDPYYEFGGGKKQFRLVRHFKAWWYCVKYRKKVNKFINNFACEFSSLYKHFPSFEKRLMTSSFYHSYSKFFSDEILFNAEYINHSVKQSEYPTDELKMEYARTLIKKYASAKLVVTSRIHCGLPCLGVETPVIFVTSEALNGNSVRSSGRFGGLIDLFHIAEWTQDGVKAVSNDLSSLIKNKKYSSEIQLKNLDKYKTLKDGLISSVRQWQKKGGMVI